MVAKTNKMKRKSTIKGKTFTIAANIFMSRYLISGDDSGTSDLYVNMKIGLSNKKTTVKWDSVNAVKKNLLIFIRYGMRH